MNYKSDKARIEDAIIPALLEELMMSHIEQMPDSDSRIYAKPLSLLMPDILKEISGSQKLCNRLNRLKGVIMGHMMHQGWTIPKAYMVLTAFADILHTSEFELVTLGKGTQKVVTRLSKSIVRHYKEESIKNQDESALKQAPKLLKIFQREGYFE